MRDGFFLLLFSRPRPCQRHDPALIPPPSAGTHAVAWRMHALVAQGTEHRIPDPGVARSNRVRGASGPSPSGRASRPQREGRGFEPRRLHDMRHAAACKRRHSEERRHVKTARPRDGIRRQRPPAGRARDGGAGRPVRGPARPRAGPCGCGAAAARLLPKQETAGSNPVIRSIREHWFSMYFIPRFRAGGPGDARTPGAGRQYAPYAPLVQRSEQRTFNPRATGPNPVGGTMLGTSPCISASIYYQIGCGSFFFRPRAKQGKENTQCDGPGKGL